MRVRIQPDRPFKQPCSSISRADAYYPALTRHSSVNHPPFLAVAVAASRLANIQKSEARILHEHLSLAVSNSTEPVIQTPSTRTFMNITVTPENYLSPLTAADAEDITAHLQDYEVSRYTRLIPHPYTLEMARGWLVGIADDARHNGRQTHWAIREQSGRLIGAIELSRNEPGSEHASEIGYWLARPFWGCGIMTRVVKIIVELGFRDFGLCRISAPIFAPNIGSARVLEKNGFVLEGALLRLAYQRDGHFYDGRLYARIRA